MMRKIAVLVRNRQEEALRMSVGLTLMDDIIDVYVLNNKVIQSDDNALNMETIKDLEMNLFSNCADNDDMQYLSTREISQRLPAYDHVLAY